MLVWHFDRGRVVIRPSGTEPKLKAYLETVVAVTGGLPASRAQADGELALLREAVVSLVGLPASRAQADGELALLREAVVSLVGL